MNVYDFDNTIFRGDSTVRFYCYCLKRRPRLVRRWPRLLITGARYLAGKLDKRAAKEDFYGFLADLPDVEALVEDFWRLNRARLKPWYLAQKRPDDLIISASAAFLLEPVCENLLASPVDAHTGRYGGPNCHGEEKARRFRLAYGDAPIEAFYSDSLSDAPLAEIAERAYLVRGERVGPWPRNG